jgi:hypothetical protein
MRFLAVIVAVPALLIGWQLWSDHSFEQRLRPVASGIAGRPDTVDCQSFWGGLIDAQAREGEVRFDASGVPESKLFLTRPTCQRLRAFAGHSHHAELDCLAMLDWTAPNPLPFDSECYARSRKTIYAVLVLAHESYHTIGVIDEAAANCFAIQAMAWTAIQLGAAAPEAELLARAMAALEPWQGGEYGTAECRAGRKFDLHPETAAFPTEHPIVPPLGHGGVPSLVGRV